MPVLDTVVLFAAADSKDMRHEKGREHLQGISTSDNFVSSFALLEFDIVMKSRGFSFDDRMEKHALLLHDYPELVDKTAPISPAIFYLSARLEKEAGLEYFDAGVAAEALQLDGQIVSTDRAFDQVEGLKRIW